MQPPPSEVQPLVATARPSEPSEGGRIAAESLLGFLAVTTSLVVGVQTTLWLILAGPLVTGAIVCGIGFDQQLLHRELRRRDRWRVPACSSRSRWRIC